MRYTLVILCALLCAAPAQSQQWSKSLEKSVATSQQDDYKFLSTDDLLMWVSNNGTLSHNPLSDGSGFEWPANSAKYVLFNEGLLVCGIANGSVHVSGTTYRPGWQAGHILAGGYASNPSDPKHRVYVVRKVDMTEYENLPTAQQQMLRKDFIEWPTDIGAPFYDHDDDGIYTPQFDKWLNGDKNTDTPKIRGTVTCWFVANDLDRVRSANVYGTSPMGLEIQFLTWTSDSDPLIRNTVFVQYTVINKGRYDIEDVYFVRWVDPDLGDAFDDFVGIDTSLAMMYCYNGKAQDAVYGSAPPALGILSLQNPMVPSPVDVAKFNGDLREGYRNLPLSAFAFYINGDAVYRDPQLGTSAGAMQMYSYARGLLWNGAQYIDPTTAETVRFPLAGDPEKSTGWIDGIAHQPGDRRMLCSSGPFQFDSGDTQQVVMATIVGSGSDAMSSLTELRSSAVTVGNAYHGDITDFESLVYVPSQLELGQNYPNPTLMQTIIPFALSQPEEVSLKLYNILGKEIAVLLDAKQAAGQHTFRLDASVLSSGIYFYVLRSGSTIETRKMLVMNPGDRF